MLSHKLRTQQNDSEIDAPILSCSDFLDIAKEYFTINCLKKPEIKPHQIVKRYSKIAEEIFLKATENENKLSLAPQATFEEVEDDVADVGSR